MWIFGLALLYVCVCVSLFMIDFGLLCVCYVRELVVRVRGVRGATRNFSIFAAKLRDTKVCHEIYVVRATRVRGVTLAVRRSALVLDGDRCAPTKVERPHPPFSGERIAARRFVLTKPKTQTPEQTKQPKKYEKPVEDVNRK